MLWLYFRPEYTDADTSALASFMRGDMYLRIGDTFYGKMMQKSTHRFALCSFTLTMDREGVWPVASNGKVLVDHCVPYYLTEWDGAIYFLRYDLSNGESRSVCRISPDGSGLKSLIEDAADYLQIVNGRIYYCKRCSIMPFVDTQTQKR